MTKTDMTASEIAQDDLIDLGKASVETYGAGGDQFDLINEERKVPGISND